MIICPSIAEYGVQDVSKYRLNSDLNRFPVRSPDDLFGFGDQMGTDFNLDVNQNENNNKNMNSYKITGDATDVSDKSDQSNTIGDSLQSQVDQYINSMMESPAQTSRKRNRKNRVKSGHRKPMASKPKKMIFSQYMSPQFLESDGGYALKPSETFKDPYLSQLMPHIMATAEQMALEKEAEDTIRSYAKVIPTSKIIKILRSSDFFHLTDSPYGLKKRSD